MDSPPPETTCRNCGTPLPPDAELCPNCGARQQWPRPATTIKKVIIALFMIGISLALGLLGSCLALGGIFSMGGGEANSGIGAGLVGGGFLCLVAAIWIFIRMIKINSR